MKITVDFDSSNIKKRLENSLAAAQIWLDRAVLNDSEPYIPSSSGELIRSARAASKIGSGEIIYNTPYARAVYYGYHNKSQTHPLATRLWFETAKAVNGGRWIKGVKEIGGR